MAQPTDPATPTTWAPRPGEPVVLTLDPGGTGVAVRIASSTVTAAHETRLEKLIRTPTTWATALAGLAVFVLVSTALATGTVRPAPPRVPTPRPGEPTPTPDTRPKLSIGGFVLQSPMQPTAVPPDLVPVEGTDPSVQAPAEGDDPSAQPALPMDSANLPADVVVVEAAPPTPAPCTNLFGFGCDAPPPPRPLTPRRAPRLIQPANTNQSVIPVASPAAFDEPGADDLQAASPGPPRGSNLEAALQAASIADDNFAREVQVGAREAAPPESSSAGSGSGK